MGRVAPQERGRSVRASVIEAARSAGVAAIRGLFASEQARQDTDASEALDYVEQALSIIHEAMVTWDGHGPVVIPKLPERDALTIADYQEAIKRVVRGSSLRELGKELCLFLDEVKR